MVSSICVCSPNNQTLNLSKVGKRSIVVELSQIGVIKLMALGVVVCKEGWGEPIHIQRPKRAREHLLCIT